MRAIETGHGAVEIAIARIPRGRRRPQRFAPRVCRLVGKAVSETFCHLCLQRVVDRVAGISIDPSAVDPEILSQIRNDLAPDAVPFALRVIR